MFCIQNYLWQQNFLKQVVCATAQTYLFYILTNKVYNSLKEGSTGLLTCDKKYIFQGEAADWLRERERCGIVET